MNRKELLKKLGRRIVQLREQKGMSQADLARACDKDPQSIERIENGKVNPTAVTLYNIAQALNIQADQIWKF